MKKFLMLVPMLLLCLGTFAQTGKYSVPTNSRVSKSVNTEWTFNYFADSQSDKAGYENPAFDDSKWSYISVPHTWQTYETTQELHPYIRNAAKNDNEYWWEGWGWYRKRIVIGKEMEDKKICFEFDGVQKYAKIYLNGKYIGDHKGGFTSFYMDVTDAVKFGQENVLVVAVNNALNDKFNIAPMNAGNWVVYGGIWRDVRVVATDKISVPFQGSYKHEGGTFVTTPKVSTKEASINIKSYVQNATNATEQVKIISVVTGSDNKLLEKIESSQSINAGEIKEFVQDIRSFKNPELWSPENPYIYNLYTEIYRGNKLSDVYHSTFGIRSIDWDYDQKRLILNGKITHLHGINRHEEYVWLGGAFPRWIQDRDLNDMAKNLEINYMRTAHYPNHPTVYSYMDKNGICINEELPNIKNQNFDPKIQEQNCREMIRRDRNHPSIIIWSMGNETDHACDGSIAWQEDKSRILTVRQPYNDSYNPQYVKHTDGQMPVESYLRCTIRGWYDKDDRNLEPSDGQWAGTEYWQHSLSRKGKPISEHNGTVWLYADHGADREYVGAPLKHVNPKGWVDSWRTPKYVYYLWQANFAKKPMVHIQPHFWREKYVGQKRMITVDSNCAQVELFVNGKSVGKLKPTKENQYCVEFKDITIAKGTIEAVATSKDGVKVADKVVMSSEPYSLTISTTHKSMASTADNLIEFKVDIVDKDGNHVYGADNTLKFNVEGPAKLVGSEIYVSDKDKSEQYEGTMYIDAPVTNLVRAVGKSGKVTITATSTGLKEASITIDVTDYTDPNPIKGITEPRINPDGREPVKVNQSQTNYLKAPMEMKHYPGELSIPLAKKAQFADLSKKFIIGQNPSIETSTPEFKYVVESFVSILNSTAALEGTRGYVVADDYNFIADQYNVCRAITKNIRSKELPDAYKEAMAGYYSKNIIGNGVDKNYMAENELIDCLPKGGVAVWTGDSHSNSSVKCVGAIVDVKDIIAIVYPESASWSKDQIKKACTLVGRFSPGVTYKKIRDKKTKVSTESYFAAPNTLLLLPDTSVILSKYSFPEKNL